MSDFYRRRRVVIKDATALLTFFLGFVWSGAFVWPFLGVEVNRGDMARGLAYFLAAVLGTAIATGMLGLEAGNVLGGIWERYHRQHRALGSEGAPAFGSPALAWAGAGNVATAERALFTSTPAARAQSGAGSVYYTTSGVYTSSFVPLVERVRPALYETARTREALARTTNIGAWDGGRLVGVVRVLSDGYTYSALADILVDPDYQRMGIGRELMQRALAAAPNARLLVDAQPDAVRFFERIGCVRGATGFLMTPPVVQ